MSKVLYLSLTGMTEPLGRSQVIEYLIDLSKNNKIYLISFERENDLEHINETKKLLIDNNIHWYYFIYSNRYGIFSTIYQLFQSLWIGSKLVKKENIKIVHARSIIPATMGMVLKKLYQIKLLFDIRGFAIDEKLDSGRLKKNGILYKALKELDNYLYRSSDHVITLTHKAKEILIQQQHIISEAITVIPTCANQKVFKLINKEKKEVFKSSLGYNKEDKIIIHTGTVSGWYDFENEVRLIKELMFQDKNIHFLLLNKYEQQYIEQVLIKYDLPKEKVKVMSSSFDEMYKYLNIADSSLFFIKSSYSKQASAPTKFAENVACYLPSITNTGVGDMEFYMNQYDVGYLVDIKNLDENLSRIASEIIIELKNNIINKNIYQELFSKHFDKNMAVNKYQYIYNLLENNL